MYLLLKTLFGDMDMKNFKCQMCGNCCNFHGYVRLEEGEVDKIAAFLEMTTSEFINKYTEILPDRSGLTLTEFDDGRCVFLDKNNRCIINDVKPQQCIDFPEKWRYPPDDDTCPALAALKFG
jgi:Fe-S-cluster containining protein